MSKQIQFELIFENTDSLRLIADDNTYIGMRGVQKDGAMFVSHNQFSKFNTVQELELSIPKTVIEAGIDFFNDEDKGYGLKPQETNWERIQFPDICYIRIEGVDYSVFDEPDDEHPFSDLTNSQRFEIKKDKDGNEIAIHIVISPESLALNKLDKNNNTKAEE